VHGFGRRSPIITADWTVTVRIGVYLLGLDPQYVGGLSTYAIGLVNGLIKNGGAYDVVVFVDADDGAALRPRIGTSPHARVVAVARPSNAMIERITAMPGASVFHVSVRNWRRRAVAEQIESECDAVIFPLGCMATYDLHVPSIVSFHDLQHEVYPRFFSWRELRARRVLYGANFRYATLIQASSAAVRDEALRVYRDRLTPERIVIIPEGVDYAAFSVDGSMEALDTYGLPPEFLFYPAQFWRHKNHLRVLEALDLIRTREAVTIPLVLTGADYGCLGAVQRFLANRKLDAQVFLLGRVAYPVLRALCRRASYVLSASLYESSCLPILEAAASGAALLVSDIAPNRESAKTFRLRMFDPNNVENMATVISTAWRERDKNGEASAQNREAARQFDWVEIARRYLQQIRCLEPDRDERGALRKYT
jgi:glycosyltransferase involved in cell wall biosynthesis